MLTAFSPPSSVTSAASDNLSLRTSKVRRKTLVKLLIVVFLLSETVTSRIGWNINNSFLFTTSMMVEAVLLPVLCLGGTVSVSITAVVAYLACAVAVFYSLVFASDHASLPSGLLLLTLYFPFVFVIRRRDYVPALWLWMMRVFSSIAVFCACASILQFFAQFWIHAPWLFDYCRLLPASLHALQGQNTVISIGPYIKSNGIFFAEPSGFSQFMAAGIVCEWSLFRRWWRIALCGFGLLLSYSGTGIMLLCIAAMFPLGGKSLLRAALLVCVASVVLYILGDVLHLWLIVDRIHEFDPTATQSSGYARFVGPAYILLDHFSDTWITSLFGHGPGTMTAMSFFSGTHDPTWAKLAYEYGIAGCFALSALLVPSLLRFAMPAPFRATLFFQWLISGGCLLSPWVPALLWVTIGMWPAMSYRTSCVAPNQAK